MSAAALQVLVVEDEAPIALAIAAALERRGHRVETAGSVAEALARDLPDVLVSDLALGTHEGGLELLAALRRRGGAARAVLLSGSPSLEACRRAMHLGADDFLAKPFRLDELVRAVEGRRAAHRPRPRAVLAHGAGEAYEHALAATPESLRAEVGELLAFAVRQGAGPAVRARIGSAASELFENVLVHAYAAEGGYVRVRARWEGGAGRDLALSVQDFGVGFDPLVVGPGHMRRSKDGGLARAAALAESVSIAARPGAGCCVTLGFRATRVHFDDDRPDLSELDYLTPEASRRLIAELERGEPCSSFQLSPALAVALGRILAGPDPKCALETALWSPSPGSRPR